MQFWEPKKEDLFTKSRDSWTSLLSQLRKLLLDSISKYLMKFEKKVRTHREKYSDANWSFIEYLKLNVRNYFTLLFLFWFRINTAGASPVSFQMIILLIFKAQATCSLLIASIQYGKAC